MCQVPVIVSLVSRTAATRRMFVRARKITAPGPRRQGWRQRRGNPLPPYLPNHRISRSASQRRFASAVSADGSPMTMRGSGVA